MREVGGARGPVEHRRQFAGQVEPEKTTSAATEAGSMTPTVCSGSCPRRCPKSRRHEQFAIFQHAGNAIGDGHFVRDRQGAADEGLGNRLGQDFDRPILPRRRLPSGRRRLVRFRRAGKLPFGKGP